MEENFSKWTKKILVPKKEVICWVARPHEKTYLVRYMLVMQLISIALTISEVILIDSLYRKDYTELR